MKRFVEGIDRGQATLFPECLADWIDENNPVQVIDVFVDELDLAALGFEGVAPELTGRPSYHPSVLLKLYIYGYLNRVQSSRRLEREAGRNVEVMWLTGRLMPDHKTTIADFRKDNGAAIRKVCARFIVLCRRLDLFAEASVAIDGSKFKAPSFGPAFRVGGRYMPDESNDIELNWTHLNTVTNGSFVGTPTQMVGPPYLIGPEAALYKDGSGNVRFAYDSVNFDGGHTFCAECAFQVRVFGGVEFARVGQNLTGMFQSPDGTAYSANTTNSLFTGAGPRVGLKGQYDLGNFQFIGEFAGAGLIGKSQSSINFATNSPAIGLNNQSLTSPNASQVIPSIDARLATAYVFPPSNYGVFKIEVGYQAAVYFNAVSQYSLTNVPTGLTLPPVGIYLATQQHLQSNFTDQGPYLTGSWAF